MVRQRSTQEAILSDNRINHQTLHVGPLREIYFKQIMIINQNVMNLIHRLINQFKLTVLLI